MVGAISYRLDFLLLNDDFEAGSLTWNADARYWSETGGVLTGTSGWAFAPIPWDPSGLTDRSLRTVEAGMEKVDPLGRFIVFSQFDEASSIGSLRYLALDSAGHPVGHSLPLASESVIGIDLLPDWPTGSS